MVRLVKITKVYQTHREGVAAVQQKRPFVVNPNELNISTDDDFNKGTIGHFHNATQKLRQKPNL